MLLLLPVLVLHISGSTTCIIDGDTYMIYHIPFEFHIKLIDNIGLIIFVRTDMCIIIDLHHGINLPILFNNL